MGAKAIEQSAVRIIAQIQGVVEPLIILIVVIEAIFVIVGLFCDIGETVAIQQELCIAGQLTVRIAGGGEQVAGIVICILVCLGAHEDAVFIIQTENHITKFVAEINGSPVIIYIDFGIAFAAAIVDQGVCGCIQDLTAILANLPVAILIHRPQAGGHMRMGRLRGRGGRFGRLCGGGRGRCGRFHGRSGGFFGRTLAGGGNRGGLAGGWLIVRASGQGQNKGKNQQNRQQFFHDLPRFLPQRDYLTAIASISTLAPLGRFATW